MAKRKSITGIRKKRPKLTNTALPAFSLPLGHVTCTNSSSHSDDEHGETAASTVPLGQKGNRRSKKNERNSIDSRSHEHRPIVEDRSRHAYAPLSPRIRHISQDVVRFKWKCVPKPIEEKIQELLRSIERPVLARHAAESRKIEAQQAIASIAATLERRLPRIPFPPRRRAIDFDYEGLLKDNRMLEQHLNRTDESVRILSDQIRRENALLDLDKENLETVRSKAQIDDEVLEWQHHHSYAQQTLGNGDSPAQITLERPPHVGGVESWGRG